jgi:hypothetical protein
MSELLLQSTEKVLRRCGHGVAVLSEANRELVRIAKVAMEEDARRQGASMNKKVIADMERPLAEKTPPC